MPRAKKDGSVKAMDEQTFMDTCLYDRIYSESMQQVNVNATYSLAGTQLLAAYMTVNHENNRRRC